MSHVSFTIRARQDLHEIRDFIAADSIEVVDSFLDTLEEKIRLLAETPHIGRVRDDLAPSLRSFATGNSIILYRSREEGIEIVRVLHASRDISTLF